MKIIYLVDKLCVAFSNIEEAKKYKDDFNSMCDLPSHMAHIIEMNLYDTVDEIE